MFVVGLLGVVPLIAALPPQEPTPQEATVFRSGTRLVEVEVVVRDKKGPVQGLTKDDFTLLDQGRPQSIAVFRSSSAGTIKPLPLPPGAVSNRQDSRGQPLNGATVVLLDQLNTKIDYKAYERESVVKFLKALTVTDRIALYSLGRDLHVLQDFTDDPQKLIAGIARLDQGLDLLPAFLGDTKGGALMDFPDPSQIHTGSDLADAMMKNAIANLSELTVQENQSIYNDITVEALRRIIQHLSGVPGRKNLVWVKESLNLPPEVMAMAQQANVTLYPVLIRTVEFGNDIFALQHAVHDFGAANGGAGFSDAAQLTTAVRTAEEDSANSYVLGYYPDEDMLDGKFHRLAVKVDNRAYEVRYRPGYLATKVPPSAQLLTDRELFEDPLDSTGVGMTAQVRPDPAQPGVQQVHMTIDLHDIHLERKDDRMTGGVDLSVLLPDSTAIKAFSVRIELTDEELEKALEAGYVVNVLGVQGHPREIRVVVRDRATGAAGSLRIPAPKQ